MDTKHNVPMALRRSYLACPGAGDAWCLTCAPLPRFPEQAHASCRHLGARIFFFGNLFRRPPAGASPSPPPADWLRGLRRRGPKRAPQHALPPPLSRACGLRVLATYCVGSRRFRVSSEK